MDFDPVSPKQASELLKTYHLRPLKRLGQNFLVDRNTLERIVRAADLQPGDHVLEIGGGMGALTLALAATGLPVTTVEIDLHLEPILRTVTASKPNVNLIFADFLQKDSTDRLFDTAFGNQTQASTQQLTPDLIPASIPDLIPILTRHQNGVVVANIPYYISSPIVERLIEHKSRLRRIVLLVQTEFANRAVARENTDDYGAMSVFVQYHTRPEIVGTVPKSVFIPQPEVSSSILTLDPVVPGTVSVQDEQRFFRIVRAAFAQRRKTLLNALLRAPASFNLGFGMDDRPLVENLLQKAGIDGNRRGETLSLQEFARLANTE